MKGDKTLSRAARLVRHHDPDRFATVLFAPADRRESLFALYAFNLEVARIREAVSEPILGEIRLQWWREAVAEIYAGGTRRDQIALALGEAIHARGLTRGHFDRLLDARGFDLQDRPPADLAALTQYAEGTSASLALLVLEALGVAEAEARCAAREVAIAWALTGLLRAVPFHARARRLYLPADLVARHGLKIGDLFELRPSPSLDSVVAEVAAVARRYLAAARARRRKVPRRAAAALLPATLAEIYLDILDRAGGNPFEPRVARRAGRWRLTLNGARGRY